jgi:hypothetical protein
VVRRPSTADRLAALVLTTLVLATTFTPIKAWLEGRVPERKGILANPDRSRVDGGQAPASASAEASTAAGAPIDDATVERVAERAADLVLRRLADAPTTSLGTPEPQPRPGPATVE